MHGANYLFALVVLALVAQPAYQQECMQTYNYFMTLIPLPYPLARLACHARGGELASARTKEENERIFSLLPDRSIPRWIGGRRWGTHGGWGWVDGSPFSTEFDYEDCIDGVDCLWMTNEPNDDGDEQCLQMGGPKATNDGAWADAECSLSRLAVCERLSECRLRACMICLSD
jgi:hypothetical protein